jgi:hypothetical protein
MEYEKSIPFKNWSNEDFQGLFGAALPSPESTVTENHSAELILDNPYLFKAGGTYSVPQSQALHFAKQLAVRELHKLGTDRGAMLSDIDMREYMGRCFPVKPSENSKTNTFEQLDAPSSDASAEDAGDESDNKTETDVQNQKEDDEDDNADDEKNNAGAPVFKRTIGRPRKDAAYVS